MEINWHDYAHDQLDIITLYGVLALRSQVFVVEQQCLYQDMDGQDIVGDNRHIVATHNNRVIACARLLAPVDKESPVAIGRVVVSPDVRGLHLGKKLMEQAVCSSEQHWPQRGQYLSAQAHLQPFYGQLGFTAYGEIYLEDGIPHISMQRVSQGA